MNPQQLRELTNQAILNAEQITKEKLKATKEQEQQEILKEQLFSEQILSQIPEKCHKAALDGRSHCVVMDLKDKHILNPFQNQEKYRTDLKGAALIVFDNCVKAQLKPTIEYWWSGDGLISGFQIVVHW